MGAGASVGTWYGDAGKAERSWSQGVGGGWVKLLMEADNQSFLLPPYNLPSEPPIVKTYEEGNWLGSLGKAVCRVPAPASKSRAKTGLA